LGCQLLLTDCKFAKSRPIWIEYMASHIMIALRTTQSGDSVSTLDTLNYSSAIYKF
jgi:hypothetical protein